MVARVNYPHSPYGFDEVPRLSEDELAEAAECRVRAKSWEATAQAIGWSAAELKRATRRDRRWFAALEYAAREFAAEGEAEMQVTLREQLRSDDEKVAFKAAERLAIYHAARRRDETRVALAETRAAAQVKVARIRGEAQVQSSGRRAGSKSATGLWELPEAHMVFDSNHEPVWIRGRRLTEADREHFRKWHEFDRRLVEDAVRRKVSVFLWGGCHATTELPNETDTPLTFAIDDTNPDRPIWWAMTVPGPVCDTQKGPFLSPPGCRPPTCPKPIT